MLGVPETHEFPIARLDSPAFPASDTPDARQARLDALVGTTRVHRRHDYIISSVKIRDMIVLAHGIVKKEKVSK